MTSKSATIEMPPKEAAKFEGFLKAFVTAADKAGKRMAREQVEIDSLKAETRQILAELKSLRMHVA